MYSTIHQIHVVSVTLFLLIYLIKTLLLVSNKIELQDRINKITKIPEMVISLAFLLTGFYMIYIIGATTLLTIKIAMVFASIPVAIIGFKKQNKGLAILSLLLIIGAYGLAEVNKKRNKGDLSNLPQSVSDTSSSTYNLVIHGEAIYKTSCEQCHGKGGEKGAMGLNLTISNFSEQEMKKRVLEGEGSMPPYKDHLTDQEINAVIAYVQTLKK